MVLISRLLDSGVFFMHLVMMDHVDDMCKAADSQEQPSPNKGMTFDKATLSKNNLVKELKT